MECAPTILVPAVHGKVEASTGNLQTFGFIGKKFVNLLSSTVVGADNEAVVIHVEDQVLSLIGK